MRRTLALVLVCAALAGCGYFNSLYNANRRFAEAEREVRAGNPEVAARAYRAAIDGAAVSYREHPDSRWADDALLLIGRARFALREYRAAGAAMEALLEQSTNRSLRGSAYAWLGAARMNLGDAAAARAPLDSALSLLNDDHDHAAFASLWRARTLFAMSDDGAWADLQRATRRSTTAWDAALEGVARAASARDSAHLATFMEALASARYRSGAQQHVDSVLRAVASSWSPAVALRASEPLQRSSWPATARDGVALSRIALGRQAGEYDLALELALDLANAVTGGAGSAARNHAGRIMLRRATDPAELEEVRTLLIRAYDNADALQLMRQVRAAQILADRGSEPGTALSLFAAAEMARDELDAPLLARRLFLDFAKLQPDNVWAGKALLAAALIDGSGEVAEMMPRYRGNAYVIAANGGSGGREIDAAEERLAWGISGLRADAIAEAILRDAVVGRAVSVLDSTRMAARLDSVRIFCGTLLDSLRVTGIRADSTRGACLRGDSARVAWVLAADTTLLRDTTTARGLRPGDPRPVQVSPDTFSLR